MKKLISLVLLAIASVSVSQVKANYIDVNINITRQDYMGFRFNSRLFEATGWDLKGFSGSGFYKFSKNLQVTYDMIRGNRDFDPITYRYGITYNSYGPNSSLGISLFQYEGFGNIKGYTGKVDLNIKF